MRLIIILALGFTSLLQAQKPFLLKNETSNEPIPFATIWTQNKVLTSSDSLGVFYVDDSYLNSKFKITALGYKTFDSIVGYNMQIIYLKSSIIQLKEVHISNTTSKRTIKFGKLNNGDAGIIAEKNKEVAQVGKFFENKMNEILFLNKIKIRSFCSEENRIATILIYSVAKNGQPDEIINSKNIVCKFAKGHNNSEVDLSHFNIEFPLNGIFIIVNYLFLEQNKQYGEMNKNWYYYEPSIDAVQTDQYIDTWKLIDNEWVKNDKFSVSYQLILNN